MICILDRSCCFPELAKVVQDQLFTLLMFIFAKAETVDARLMGIRAISRCALTEASCLDSMPDQGMPAMFLMMAVSNCLKVDAGDNSENTSLRQAFNNRMAEMQIIS